MKSLGKILLTPKGEYSKTTVYRNLDWVRYDGGSWVCKIDGTVGIAPAENDNWTCIAQNGSVAGEIGWNKVTGKPFNGVSEEDFTVDEDGNLRSNTPDITWDNIEDKPFNGISEEDFTVDEDGALRSNVQKPYKSKITSEKIITDGITGSPVISLKVNFGKYTPNVETPSLDEPLDYGPFYFFDKFRIYNSSKTNVLFDNALKTYMCYQSISDINDKFYIQFNEDGSIFSHTDALIYCFTLSLPYKNNIYMIEEDGHNIFEFRHYNYATYTEIFNNDGILCDKAIVSDEISNHVLNFKKYDDGVVRARYVCDDVNSVDEFIEYFENKTSDLSFVIYIQRKDKEFGFTPSYNAAVNASYFKNLEMFFSKTIVETEFDFELEYLSYKDNREYLPANVAINKNRFYPSEKITLENILLAPKKGFKAEDYNYIYERDFDGYFSITAKNDSKKSDYVLFPMEYAGAKPYGEVKRIYSLYPFFKDWSAFKNGYDYNKDRFGYFTYFINKNGNVVSDSGSKIDKPAELGNNYIVVSIPPAKIKSRSSGGSSSSNYYSGMMMYFASGFYNNTPPQGSAHVGYYTQSIRIPADGSKWKFGIARIDNNKREEYLNKLTPFNVEFTEPKTIDDFKTIHAVIVKKNYEIDYGGPRTSDITLEIEKDSYLYNLIFGTQLYKSSVSGNTYYDDFINNSYNNNKQPPCWSPYKLSVTKIGINDGGALPINNNAGYYQEGSMKNCYLSCRDSKAYLVIPYMSTTMAVGTKFTTDISIYIDLIPNIYCSAQEPLLDHNIYIGEASGDRDVGIVI